jgi:DNA-binding NtrC family response regulator
MSDQLPTVLIVDDEIEILRILKKTLEDDYNVLTASRAREAMQMMRSDVAVVLSDQRMPEMTGAELFRHLRQQFPDTVRVVMTGYSDMNALIDSVNQGEIFRYLAKPWEMETLLSTMQEAVARYRRNVEVRRLSDELNRARQELDHTRRELQQLRSAGR